jgi:ANTAR domain
VASPDADGAAPADPAARPEADSAAPADPAARPEADSAAPADPAARPEADGAAPADGGVQPDGSGERLPSGTGTAVYRTAGGWRVGEDDLPDLISAMVFADLLTDELPSATRPSAADVTDADPRTAKLRMTIAQLEHALASRVRVEQAIGILAERHRLPPRQAFELLRGAARSRGRRVHELADEVVASITNPLLPLPAELARPPRAHRSRGRSRPG